jgi:hypothetical protein
MRRGLGVILGLSLLAGLARAEAPTTSIRPVPSPVVAGTMQTQPSVTTLRPRARPIDRAAPVLVAAPVERTTKPTTTRKGSVCNNPAIKGVVMKPIKSRTKGCSVPEPVQVTSVEGVRLMPPATINCNAANALSDWVTEGLQPAFNNQIVQLNIVDSYSCRPRNNVRGNRISEHGLGNAIDISGFVLSTGKVLTVAGNYGTQIKRAKKAACGTFRTTLGPGSDGYHEDHIHLDVSQRGGSPYCR